MMFIGVGGYFLFNQAFSKDNSFSGTTIVPLKSPHRSSQQARVVSLDGYYELEPLAGDTRIEISQVYQNEEGPMALGRSVLSVLEDQRAVT